VARSGWTLRYGDTCVWRRCAKPAGRNESYVAQLRFYVACVTWRWRDYNRRVLKRLTRRDAGKSFLTGLAVARQSPRHAASARLSGLHRPQPHSDHARETLQRLAAIGYREAEVIQDRTASCCRCAKSFAFGVSGHFATPLVREFRCLEVPVPTRRAAGMTWQKAVDDAAQAGMKYMVIAYLMPAERRPARPVSPLRDQFNKAGEATHKAGMQFATIPRFRVRPKEGSRRSMFSWNA